MIKTVDSFNKKSKDKTEYFETFFKKHLDPQVASAIILDFAKSLD